MTSPIQSSDRDNEEDLPSDLLSAAEALIHAAKYESLTVIQQLLASGAPAWYQDPDLGWSCLHYAAERRDPELLRALLKGGAVWNAVDLWGQTAGEVCISLGDQECWEVIRNEGVRSEMLHHILKDAGQENGTGLTLRERDDTSAGNNDEFLKSELRWELGEDGKERVLDADGNGVMMGWEEPLMQEHVRLMTVHHPDAQIGGEGMSILNIGYGLGIVNPPTGPAPRHHTIIEAHPQVLAHMREQGVYQWPNVRVLEGRWQDWLLDLEKLGETLAGTPSGMGFGAVFMDTFAEGYEELKKFFDVLPDILDGEDARFSFWNGLGATTDATIYSVSCNVAELHMEDVGLSVEWHDIFIPESQREEVWRGVKRKYWDLPGYRLPIAQMASPSQ
ncbi:hypothetical protein TREMEDRAFT_73009 [Tremella mesenterica DSM 1558]|uniref:uncharacterized protein n=1 Tax=Tremella mesenterica (strain ATCC 24925 / CBS 8224 / DSM 1558 / NBRC 9311 / NRRL Y-6157 / RJB 2259-6 / UBC 559-6) TaxID=578456 RepID=UPI0003F497C7|nr:uncharacterized protein TREMEDRAFT_73009 [Tremella mesenterica DSM 1558]EIW73191.1 hypothetical protein TREMEDRAFT_73009 [Tremella mesenterica DSM 1558]